MVMSRTSNTQRTGTEYPSKTASHKLSGRNILLAEDSPDQQRLFATLLRQANANVTLECNGSAAVERLAKREEEFDAVIIDFMMPVMDGVEATRQLRAHGYPGVIIAITAFGNRISEEEWLSAGADLFLLKPIGPTNFVAMVQQAVSSTE